MAAYGDSFLKIGGKFGIYDVVRELGRGGMGAVYLVRDPESGEELAAKVMYPESPAVREHFVRRFIREAEIAMRVTHPNLVRVLDVGRDPDTGLGFMLMEYLSGGSLRERLKARLAVGAGPYPVHEALEIVRQVAEALATAAAHGIVHRDVKPDNIIFGMDGTPHLADLGVAKAKDGDETTTTLTMSNMVVGTPAYMAPEQMLNSHAVDARADVYSLGIVLWELLAGDRPTAGASAAELMARALRAERIPDIRTRRKGVPTGIVELVRRMTEPDAERRFASPDAVVRFIEEWRDWERRRLRAWLIGSLSVGVVLTLAVLAGGIWYIAASAPERQVPTLDVEINTARAPTMAELTARAEAKAREAQAQEAKLREAKAQEAKAREAKVQAVNPPAPQSKPPPPPSPVAAPQPPSQPQPPPQPLPDTSRQSTIEELVALFAELVKDSSGNGLRQIDAAVNEARRIDPDMSSVSLDGKRSEGGRKLSEAEVEAYRKGVAFLRMELFRRQNGRLPTVAEAQSLLK